MPRDLEADQLIATIKQTNNGLVRFKCVGKITISNPENPIQSYRMAIAGRLNDHLRIDLFAPFGGAAGTVASDGRHLFLVLHASRDYFKKRFGNGSLRRFVKMDVTVGDLLELLVGRMPLDEELVPRITSGKVSDSRDVCLVNRWGRTRQWITLGANDRPLSAKWFDDQGRQVLSFVFGDWQVIDGFDIPVRIDLTAASGQTVSIRLDRYEANVPLDDGLFAPPPISS